VARDKVGRYDRTGTAQENDQEGPFRKIQTNSIRKENKEKGRKKENASVQEDYLGTKKRSKSDLSRDKKTVAERCASGFEQRKKWLGGRVFETATRSRAEREESTGPPQETKVTDKPYKEIVGQVQHLRSAPSSKKNANGGTSWGNAGKIRGDVSREHGIHKKG